MLKTKSLLLSCLFAASAAVATAAPAPAAGAPRDPGGIIFIGDSITQGGKFNAGMLCASYRYALFKHFVDNGVAFRPMGMAEGAALNAPVPTPDYRGHSFANVHEAAASGRSYQPAGHAQDAGDGKLYWPNPNSIVPAEHRGPLTAKFGMKDPFTGKAGFYFNGSQEVAYTGPTFSGTYNGTKAQTACILIGINDLYDRNPQSYGAKYPHSVESIIGNTQRIVTTLQAYNEGIGVVVMQLLPVGAQNGARHQGIDDYNRQLSEAAAHWSTPTSTVTCADVSAGFYAEDGAMIDTVRGAHPNAQGELIVAGNLARVLGVGQRTLGYERKDASQLAAHADLSSTTPGIAVAASATETGTVHFVHSSPRSAALWRSRDNTLSFDSGPRTAATWLQLDMAEPGGSPRPATYEFTVKMNHAGQHAADNFLAVFVGDGVSGAGLLTVGEDGIYWGVGAKGTLLYGAPASADSPHRFTQGEQRLRIIVAPDAAGTGSIFHVWLGDQLIGEGLTTNIPGHYRDSLLFGKVTAAHSTHATISDISLEWGAAYAPAGEKRK